jgi:hypothetical protein
MARDLGVRADYVDRAFRKEDSLLDGLRNSDRAHWRLVAASERRRDLAMEALEKLQAQRPLRPPGKR